LVAEVFLLTRYSGNGALLVGGHERKVIIFGATGMVGGGVLRECLLDSGVEQVLTVSEIENAAALTTRSVRHPALGSRASRKPEQVGKTPRSSGRECLSGEELLNAENPNSLFQ